MSEVAKEFVMRGFILGFLFLVGCPTDAPSITEFTDEGVLCLQGTDLLVDWQTCLSSSCDTLTDAECTVALEGGVLTLTTYGRIESVGTECTDDCGLASVTCVLPDIPDPSVITVEHGVTTVGLDAIPACPAL